MTTLELLEQLRGLDAREADAVERTWPMTLAAIRAGHDDHHLVHLKVGKGRVGQDGRRLGGLRAHLDRELERELETRRDD
jgi:hypothetical protein